MEEKPEGWTPRPWMLVAMAIVGLVIAAAALKVWFSDAGERAALKGLLLIAVPVTIGGVIYQAGVRAGRRD